MNEWMGKNKAHQNKETGEFQTVEDHSKETDMLSRDFAVLEMKEIAGNSGLLHDIGKYLQAFARRMEGSHEKVDHSICGAKEAMKLYPGPIGLMMAYDISGHHSGIPDGGFINDTPGMPTLHGRLKKKTGDYNTYKNELNPSYMDSEKFIQFLLKDCNEDAELALDKFAFWTRYLYSCITDADSVNTAEFYRAGVPPKPLKADFRACLKKSDAKLKSLQSSAGRTQLQEARSLLQDQVFKNAKQDAEIYLMNMPTGSGKTLCSIKLALEMALRKGMEKKRIIYVIPFNSIIDQTVEVLKNLFGKDAQILRHQSTFTYDGSSEEEDGCSLLDFKNAAENWDAQIIVTTAVQFFESAYANKRGKLRKMHNMADSILIFDEAHLMPVDYLQPCLRLISYITRYLNSKAVFLTATMPDFESLIRKYALPNSRIVQLVTDRSLFPKFQKRKYVYTGKQAEEILLGKAMESPSSLIVVNSRADARRLYHKCKGKGGGKKYCLSTHIPLCDRQKKLSEIREELDRLDKDYPDGTGVPEERRIIIISTSLIEAGVDIDVHTGFRELAGIENILQTGGRINREGKREQAYVYVFELDNGTARPSLDERGNITKEMFRKYTDISCAECIEEYFRRLFLIRQDDIQKNMITKNCSSIESIPFKQYAEQFKIIDSEDVPVIVPRNDESREIIRDIKDAGMKEFRKLQKYACSVRQYELNELIHHGAVDDYGTGVYILTDMGYYDEDTGIQTISNSSSFGANLK